MKRLVCFGNDMKMEELAKKHSGLPNKLDKDDYSAESDSEDVEMTLRISDIEDKIKSSPLREAIKPIKKDSLFAHPTCCLAFPSVFGLADVENMRFYVADFGIFKDRGNEKERMFKVINQMEPYPEGFWCGAHDKLVQEYFEKECSICGQVGGRLKVTCKFNTNKCTYRLVEHAEQEYVSKIGYNVGNEGYEYCNNYVHAFCAMNDGKDRAAEKWDYQILVECEQKSGESSSVPFTLEKDYEKRSKMKVQG